SLPLDRIHTAPTPRPPRPTLFPYTTLFRFTWPARSKPPKPPRSAQMSGWLAGWGQHPSSSTDGSRHGRRDDEPSRHGHPRARHRSEEHTSELQSPGHHVCRLALETKNEFIL